MSTTGLSASAPRTADSESHNNRDEAAPPRTADTSMRCPDPSAHHHTKNGALQNQASAAALYSTSSSKPQTRGINPLGPDGKLSSAGRLQ
jgi:hypothetical protein